jgi:hypothetical protein
MGNLMKKQHLPSSYILYLNSYYGNFESVFKSERRNLRRVIRSQSKFSLTANMNSS